MTGWHVRKGEARMSGLNSIMQIETLSRGSVPILVESINHNRSDMMIKGRGERRAGSGELALKQGFDEKDIIRG